MGTERSGQGLVVCARDLTGFSDRAAVPWPLVPLRKAARINPGAVQASMLERPLAFQEAEIRWGRSEGRALGHYSSVAEAK